LNEYVIYSGGSKKGRAFAATCVSLAVAYDLFEEAASETCRPLWAMFAGSEQELRPFIANLRVGRKAEPRAGNGYGRKASTEDRLEFLKTVAYQVSWQREPEGCLVTVYHPELFKLDPGFAEGAIRFAMFVPDWWLAEQGDAFTPELRARAAEHVEKMGTSIQLETETVEALVPTAALFASYIDRRSRCPILADPVFHLRLLVSCVDADMASFPGTDVKYGRDRSMYGRGRHGFHAWGLNDAGIPHAIAFNAGRDAFEDLLAEQTAAYLGL
jgi:hypothetical protein